MSAEAVLQAFEHTPPEARELLKRPIRDLKLRIEGSPLEKYVKQLQDEIQGKGLVRFRPACYLSDEWACPDREPIIGIPFYLADPKVAAIERQLNDLEDEREIMMYLRHEAGHAFNYAYQLYDTKEWLDLFGPFDRPYLDNYTPIPFSRRFVRHIAGWYAQKHPDEDFAETFAVWLTPRSAWKKRYAGWPAMQKLEYVDRLARELANRDPPRPLAKALAELPVEEMTHSLEEFYSSSLPDDAMAISDLVPDAELEDIFTAGPAREGLVPAGTALAAHRKTMTDKIAYWTGIRRSLAKKLVETILRRSRELELFVDRAREAEQLLDVTVLATTLAMNYLQRGKFAEK
ncbi:MAG TPA: putative zinc-binding metallopeptidase [Myxococcales bacterium]|nr:putative zinc-binding metallopeptidase [Myxococcales bacterium]